MKVLSAYNAGSDRVLSPRLIVVDAARDPARMTKILMKGLAPEERNGVWLINYSGVPIVQATSIFDVIYLDQECRVLQSIEIAPGREFEPCAVLPASALILPPQTVARSRTFTGDRITLEQAEKRSEPSSSPSKPTAPPPSRVPREFSALPQSRQATRSMSAVPAGRLIRGRKREPDEPSPLIPTARARRAELDQAGAAANAGSASTPLTEVDHLTAGDEAASSMPAAESPIADSAAKPFRGARRLIAPIPGDFAPLAPKAARSAAVTHIEPKRTGAPTPREIAPAPPAPTFAEVRVKLEQPVVTHSFPATRVAPWETPQTDLPALRKDAHHPQDIEQSSAATEKNPQGVWSRLLSGDKKIRGKRRAPRIDSPGLVGYYFAGGNSVPHEIRNISVLGFYMVTDQRWMPGTVIRVTLQSLHGDSDDSRLSVTAFSRVVYWGPDGGGFEFVFVAPTAA